MRNKDNMWKEILIYVAGVVTGFIISALVGGVIYLVSSDSPKNEITLFEEPISYEGKSNISFEVFKVVEEGGLAREKSAYGYQGKIVLITATNIWFYTYQIIEVKEPIQTGVYRFNHKTVPVIDVSKNYY